MGYSAQVQQAQTSGGKGQAPVPTQSSLPPAQPSIQTNWGASAPQPMGKGGVQTNSATSGQPRMGQQNQYSNTVGQWDNTQIQPVQRNGKGKGA